jgi:hypothetical protein
MTTIRALLARAPGTLTFTKQVADRLVGQRVHAQPGSAEGPAMGKVVKAWVEADGKEVHADLELTPIGEKLVKVKPEASIVSNPRLPGLE